MADRKDDRSGFGGWMDVSSPNRKCTGWFRKCLTPSVSRYSDLEYDYSRKFTHMLKNLSIPWTFLASYPHSRRFTGPIELS